MARPNIRVSKLQKFRPSLRVTRGLATAAEMNNLLQRGGDENLFDEFVLSVNTENAGTSASNQFTLPLRAGETYNFIATIDDVDLPAHTTDVSPTYTFDVAGVNIVMIRGADDENPTEGFPGLHFNNGGDRLKALDLISWGLMEWTSLNAAFYGCSNMPITSTDVVPMTNVTDCELAFRNCGAFVVDDKWDFSNVTTMMEFSRNSGITGFNPAGNLDNVLTMSNCFRSTPILSIGSFGLPACTIMNNMCLSCQQLSSIVNFTDLSAIINASGAFQNTDITEVPAFNMPICTNMSSMFEQCEFLITVQQMTLGSVTNISLMFINNFRLVNFVGVMDFSTVTNMDQFCNVAPKLIAIPLWDLSSVLDFSMAFKDCGDLVTVPNLSLTVCTTMQETFCNAASLLTVPNFNASTGTVSNMQSCFDGSGITTMPDWDVSNVITFEDMFFNCSDLVNSEAWALKAASSIVCSFMFENTGLLTAPAFTNTDSITNMNSMFKGGALSSFPAYDFSNVTNMNSFVAFSDVVTVPNFTAPLCTVMFGAFRGCSSLITVETITAAILTQATDLFRDCIVLGSVAGIASGTITLTPGMFRGCGLITSIPLFNTALVTNANDMFNGCIALATLPAYVWDSNSNFANFLTNVTLLTTEYSELLTSIDANGLSTGTLDGGNSKHSGSGTSARDSLVVKSWSITDAGAGSASEIAVRNSSGDVILNSSGGTIIVNDQTTINIFDEVFVGRNFNTNPLVIEGLQGDISDYELRVVFSNVSGDSDLDITFNDDGGTNYRNYEMKGLSTAANAAVGDSDTAVELKNIIGTAQVGLLELSITGKSGDERYIDALYSGDGAILKQSSYWKNMDDEITSMTLKAASSVTCDAHIMLYKTPKDADQGSWALVETKVFSSSSADQVFSGLDGDVDIQYKIDVQGNADAYQLRLNNDPTAIYKNQRLYNANGSINTGNAATQTAVIPSTAVTDISFLIHAETGKNRLIIVSAAQAGGSNQQVEGAAWYNESVTNITSLAVTNLSSSTGTAKLYRRKNPNATGDVLPFQTIFSEEISGDFSAGVTIPVTGDDLNLIKVEFLGGGSASTPLQMRINGDAGPNYVFQRIIAFPSAVFAASGASTSFNFGNASVDASSAVAYLYPQSGEARPILLRREEFEELRLYGQWWDNSVDEITSIKIYASNTNTITGTLKVSILPKP